NNARRYGVWEYEICHDPSKLRDMLIRHADVSKVLPFRIVQPKKGEQFHNCVPLTSLRAAAGRWSVEQGALDEKGEWASEWVTFETTTKFGPGMFVARVQGDSMEPDIPSGSYCLFRAPRGGSRQGRR